MRAIRIAATGCAVALCISGAACSSSAKSASETTPPTTVVAPSPGSPDTPCPFSGSTDSQSEPGASSAAVLDSVAPTASGCIDNVTFGFADGLASSVTAYQAGASTTGAVLVVTLKNATLGGNVKAGTTLNPKSVNYVSKVQVSEASGNVVFDITLDKERPFLVSSSEVPAQLVIAIG